MAYKLNNTFGTLLVTLADGTIDIATTDLTLIGKGYAGFGERLNENLIKLLENFNNTSAPNNKQQGQLWYDKTNNQINVYTGAKWKPVGSTTNSATTPTNAVLGDMWFDTGNNQLYVYTGATWTLIGPTTVAGSGVTQIVSETVEDNTGVNQSILKLVTADTVVGVVSAVAFTPSSTETNGAALLAAGFATVAQGIQLSTAVANAKFRGTAELAESVTVSANNATNETVYLTFVDGETGTQGIETDTNLSYNPSTNVLSTTASQAQYADLAERYEADCELGVGDVVILGGQAEITKCQQELDDAVFGVVSESPAFLMNAQAGNNDTHPMIALKGRVYVKIKGTGQAGDRIVSAGNGEARVANIDECTAFNTLGRLLKHKYKEETALTECVIGVK
jgi:hypothetical protein